MPSDIMFLDLRMTARTRPAAPKNAMRQMLTRILLLCALLAALVVAPAPIRAASPAIDPALAAALDQILAQTVASGNIPGAAMSVLIPGQGTWAGARGLDNRDGGTALTPDALFDIASISKLFVATV